MLKVALNCSEATETARENMFTQDQAIMVVDRICPPPPLPSSVAIFRPSLKAGWRVCRGMLVFQPWLMPEGLHKRRLRSRAKRLKDMLLPEYFGELPCVKRGVSGCSVA